MIIDTLVVVVCLMVGTPCMERVEQVPVNRFTEQFQRADSLFDAASSEAMKSALLKTRLERYRALGIITNGEYRFLKEAEKELDEMKELEHNTVQP